MSTIPPPSLIPRQHLDFVSVSPFVWTLCPGTFDYASQRPSPEAVKVPRSFHLGTFDDALTWRVALGLFVTAVRRRTSPVPAGPPPRRSETLSDLDCPSYQPRTPQDRGRPLPPTRPVVSRKRRRSKTPSGPPRLRSASPSGPPALKRSRTVATKNMPPPPAIVPKASPQKALIMAWLKDGSPPIRIHLTPDESGFITLSEHKIHLVELELEQQCALEKYGPLRDGSMGWQCLPWDAPVYAEVRRVIVLRYAEVKDLHKWDAYLPHLGY
ncbi:hypothetical protein MSAN_01112300 [Mycena sanguinolenta]|uniref:Uncharacterized protein n=1 Tax=Mycena sanguinolenta TaxID=230812 RepID=A0A8H6YMY7_9AGAR|nr:hypothetical protein MSAN_01112300 [Mycena sanguinolenta]